jgi:hypothetical protein
MYVHAHFFNVLGAAYIIVAWHSLAALLGLEPGLPAAAFFCASLFYYPVGGNLNQRLHISA